MSKITLQANASGTGTFTIASPNSNTSRTITLPDADGEISLGGTPTGTLIYFASSTPPSGFLKANGAAISRSTYADLFAVIGTTWGVGNGSTTFNVPDLRGEFVRGWDDARGVDSGRSFGSSQADEFKSHTHSIPKQHDFARYASPNVASGHTTTNSYSDTLAAGGSETRPRNIVALACIKY